MMYPRLILALLLMLPALGLAEIQADTTRLALLIEEEKRPAKETRRIRLSELAPQAYEARSWALALDNDILAPGHRDQDYTYGITFTLTGPGAGNTWLSLDKPLTTLDRLLGLEAGGGTITQQSLEFGFFGFTPEDIQVADPNPDDRPYASLVYASSTREHLDPIRQTAWKSTLTLGVLGLDLVGSMQDRIHSHLDGNRPRGWRHQISDGGELTGRYALAYQVYLGAPFDGGELKSSLQASVGYITEASWSLSLRAGRFHSPWSSFNPELASYGEKSSYASSAQPANEGYFWGGITIKARAYNAFLQGQMRDSAVTFDANQLRPVLLEAWLGYTQSFAEGFRLSYVIRAHSAEIKHGAGNRDLIWGSLILARQLH